MLKIFILTLITIFISNLILSIINKIKFKKNLLFLSLCFYLLFYHLSLKTFLPLSVYSSEVALIIILICFIIIWYLLKFEKFKKIISIYFIFLFLVNFSFVIKEKFFFFNNIDKNEFTNNDFFAEKLNNQKQRNMYLIILDEATSLDLFEKNYSNFNKNKFLNLIDKEKYTYIQDSYSSYNTTEMTFASFFYLDYFLNEKSPKFKDTAKFYPQMLRYNFNDLPLIKVLNKYQYNFYLIGNTRNKCEVKAETCLNKTQSKTKIINNELAEIFFLKSPLYAIYNKVSEKVRRSLKIKTFNKNYKNNDAISKFINFTKGTIPEKSFFLIHNFYPHAPYIYDENCNEKKGDQVITTRNTNQIEKSFGYYENYLCALKKTLKIISYIDKHDPDAVVVIQADHGHYFNKNIKDKMKIFNLVKKPSDCKILLNEKIDNVNAARLLLRCGLNLNIKILDKESYWTPYSTKDNNWGEIKRIF